MISNKVIGGAQFPCIELPKLGGGKLNLGAPEKKTNWKMVVVYRGGHCPMCTRYLRKIGEAKSDFAKLGVDIVATSADDESQALEHFMQLKVNFPVTYGLTVEMMRELGLYISRPLSTSETNHFYSEPGVFIINEHNEIQILDISNGPFARPEIDVLLSGIHFIRDKNYPVRGTFN
ncbi:redoxin domain-containing protein [Ferrimonas aestuarii]|uniref:Redoxin domain-containing protein n=1 Tax=Ferrimonas aestuarii TaxID=2569539 RepID=A0A4V5NYF8_9GAMM|nr:redoxin domain-containing protein [Ferrimonas aestuarii]TKB53376.1 redoxin domain-containing protein [Ferrimonas aestuarii]